MLPFCIRCLDQDLLTAHSTRLSLLAIASARLLAVASTYILAADVTLTVAYSNAHVQNRALLFINPCACRQRRQLQIMTSIQILLLFVVVRQRILVVLEIELDVPLLFHHLKMLT